MTTPENPQPEHQHVPEQKTSYETLDETKWDHVANVIRVQTQVFEARGGRAGYIIYDNGDPENRTFEHNADQQDFPASSDKLHVAEGMVTSLQDPNEQWAYPARMVDLTGGGRLDKAGLIDRARNKEYVITAGDAIHAMLNDSSNTPVRLVAEQFGDGGEALTGIYADLGYKKTTLEPHPNGRFNFQASTPRETLQSLERILEFPETMAGDSKEGDEEDRLGVELAEKAADALWTNTVTNHGIRQGIRPRGRVRVASKSGEYNGDPGDETSPPTPAVRNDVFTVTDGTHRVSGAIFMSGDEARMDNADDILKQVGLTLKYAFTQPEDEIGSTGLRNTVRPPEA